MSRCWMPISFFLFKTQVRRSRVTFLFITEKSLMEGGSEHLDEDVQEEGRLTVLWERCIQQSILVELSEDESLHLSDLESSLALHLSQAESAVSEASIHLSGSAELSALDDSSENSVVSSNNVNVVENISKSITLHLSAQRPNTMHDKPSFKQGFEDPGPNTSDEDQEDLPYDNDLGSPYFNQTSSSTGNSDGADTVYGSPDPPDLPEKDQSTNTKPDESFEAIKQTEVAPPCSVPTNITHLLLRHFSQEELLRTERLIEAETLPEVSLLESVDDSVFSLAPTAKAPANYSSKTNSSQERSHNASKIESLEEKTEKKIDDFSSDITEKNMSNSASLNQIKGNDGADETEQNKTKEDDQNQRVPLIRTRSFSEMKYGQGQVHYPLPDFSKVAPKVKIPKAPNGPVRPVLQSPNTIHRARSSPGMLEVISRVLEDSIPPSETPYVFKDIENQIPAALVHQLKTEYDKLLTRYAESDNLMDQMKPEPNVSTHPPSHDAEKQLEIAEETHPKYLISPLSLSENFVEKEGESTQYHIVKEATRVLSKWNEDNLSDGERMTAELREIVVQFIQKVEEFKCNVTSMAVSTAEQQMILRSMMEAQDELKRKYISQKEEHRALEMQNYIGLSRNTGTFDPDRLVEGDIFRIGMHLEDIKEVIDRNTYEQISPPHSSSTPTSIAIWLNMKPSSPTFHTSSPSPSLLEGKLAGFITESCKEDGPREEDKEGEADTSEVNVNGGLNPSSELRTAGPLNETVGQPFNNSQLSSPSCFSDLLGSAEGPHCPTAEDEQETTSGLSERTAHWGPLVYPSGTRSPSKQSQWTTDSVALNTSSECDLDDCVSLAVEVSCSSHPPRGTHSISEPVVNTSSVSQRILGSETDSGFGSSYLNQSATKTFQPNDLTGSVHSEYEDLSNPDSEASCSNLETAIHTDAVAAHSSIQTLHCEEAAAAVKLWVESTTNEPSVRLQRTVQIHPVPLHNHISEPTLSTTMDAVTDRRSPLNSCSCNSEAILALQTEVSKLKRDLEQGLVQLPHLAQRMDYLTSSLGKSSSKGRTNLRSSLLRVEDWTSSDMERSKSKDSGGGSCSEIMSPFTVGSECLTSELRNKLQHTTPSNRGRMGISSMKGEDKQHAKQRPQAIKSFNIKERWSPSLQKSLLQVNYGSSCSLPASYKVREPQLQSSPCHRKRSTQSDTALLPSNVYFQETPSSVSVPLRGTSRSRGKKQEDMNRTLDQAIEVARILKRTTDCMARRLSADLAKAQMHKKLYNTQPREGRKHHTS
ncbi:uncharacterized protein LOC124869661 isoform X3 [Girardinichthys multiradiatus]|uniref:uncharacterized protein LOC124869661 isoform X3 n=1 Tax=Girardinichthys multiradiatus TaxID=208333 RepID=UPI001FAB549D|nr:uncharacterized protein LOC124869661 isoform X3 [Girardinichthys multiradiatus]